MGEASKLEAYRCDGKAEQVEASVEATNCGVDTDDVMTVGTSELEAACEGDVGEAIVTSGKEDGELETRVGENLAERCIAANEQLATG